MLNKFSRALLLTSICVIPCFSANYNCTSTGTGDFNAAGTWASCNSTFPDNSTDTFTFSIGATHDVTISSGVEVTVGQSLAANTAQGTMANTGQLILAAGSATDPTILTMKGDLAGTTVVGSCTLDGATNCNYVEMNPGTVLLIDSDSSGTAYAVGQTSAGNSRWFKADCTDSTSMPAYNAGTTYGIGWRVSYGGVNYISTANSNTGNTPNLFDSAYWQRGNCLVMSIGATNGIFSTRGAGFGGGNVYFRYVAIKNLGTSTVDAIAGGPNSGNNPVGGIDIMHSSLMNSGAVDLYNGDRTATSIHRFSNNISGGHLNSSDPSVQMNTSTNVRTTGVREIKENVLIGGAIGVLGTPYCEGCTVEGNYVDTFLNMGAYTWGGAINGLALASFSANFWLKHVYNSVGINVNAPSYTYNYVVNGSSQTNPRWYDGGSRIQANQDVLMEYNVADNLGPNITGDCFMVAQASNGRTHTIRRNYSGLGRDNESACNIITYLGASSPGGTDNHVYTNNFTLATALGIAVETSVHWAGGMTVQNNTFARYNSVGAMSKVKDVNSCTTNPNDVCSAAGCNYNLGVDLSDTPPGGCTNAHNGYILDLSSATGWGANDVNLATVAEAQFIDTKRSFATAATEFFGKAATAGAWSNASVSYAIGDIVSLQNTTWQGQTVLYRALAAHTSADTNRPGNGATWQTACSGGPCWEYASAYFLREKIAIGERITDASIGANNEYPTKAMALWVLHGMISNRRDLQCIGSDGESPWPIAYCAKGKAMVSAL